MAHTPDIEQYLQDVGRFCDQPYAQRLRRHFRDHRGSSELAMLASPTQEEFRQFRSLVAAMTPQEKNAPETLSDLQIQQCARRASVDPGLAAIFINGFVLNKNKQHKET